MELSNIIDQLKKLVSENKLHEAKGVCLNLNPILSAPLSAVLDKKENKTHWESKVQREFDKSSLGLKKFLWVIATIGSASPFLGLFGTVSGIISSFESMSSAGRGGFNVIAGGLSEALITTAAGIIVAVMALFIFNYLSNEVIKLKVEFKSKLEELVELVE